MASRLVELLLSAMVPGAVIEIEPRDLAQALPDVGHAGVDVQLIADLAERGLAGRLLLGGDTGRSSTMRAYGGGPGLDYVFARFKPRLERELGEELSRRIFVENPARAFAFEPR